MLKLLLAAAPYFLSTPSRQSKKQIANRIAATLLCVFGAIMLSAAFAIYITALYGAAIGFMSVGLIFLSAGILLVLLANKPALERGEQSRVETSDPIAALLPSSVMKDPTVSKLLEQVSANPLATSLAAATIGMLLTREIMKE